MHPTVAIKTIFVLLAFSVKSIICYSYYESPFVKRYFNVLLEHDQADAKLASWNIDPTSAVVSISFAPILILLSIPIDGNHESKRGTILRHCLSFASGSLIGDAFLHRIPYSMKIHAKEDQNDVDVPKHGHRQNSYFKIGLYILTGVIFFLILQKLLKIGLKSGYSTIIVTILLEVIHNFVNGVTIGASFTTGEAFGLAMAITISFHEILHKMGDFAILVRGGMSKKKTVSCQMMTSLVSVTGCLVVTYVKEAEEAANSCAILAFMAGGIIYNATVNVLSELKEDIYNGTESLIETCLFLAGICVMKLTA